MIIEKMYNEVKTYRFLDYITNDVYITDDLVKFAEEFNLEYSSLTRLVNGKLRRTNKFYYWPYKKKVVVDE